MNPSTYETYPARMVVTCNAVGLGIYAIGLFLLSQLGIVWGALYAGYCLWMEWRLLNGSCRSCYYYGKRCGFGKGRLCAWLFARREVTGTSPRRFTWWNLVPDFLVSLIPLGVGIAVLIRGFSWLVLIAIVVLVGLGSVGTGFVRSQIACHFCKQRELGCPAEQLFGKTKHA